MLGQMLVPPIFEWAGRGVITRLFAECAVRTL